MARPTFLGMSVVDVKCSAGWGPAQTSTLEVTLVPDPKAGESPHAPARGSPVYFNLGSLKFYGLLQKFVKTDSQAGTPVYKAYCVDPREILDGATLIINQFTGNVTVPNVVNCYAWWEKQQGYGSSLANDAGMPWNKVRVALSNVLDDPKGGPYGSPLTFRGFKYSLDLSQLPVPDDGYRIPGPTVGLLEAITAICDDGGCDFLVELRGFRIVVKTVSRRNQPLLGVLANYVASLKDAVIRKEVGDEVRNETTSVLLVGGDVCGLHQMDRSGVGSFWGYDVQGVPIVGKPGTFEFRRKGALLGTAPCEFMTLNATGVEDVVGSLSYPCSTIEMRLAMVNYDSWAAFIRAHRPEVSKLVYSPFDGAAAAALRPVKPDVVDARKDTLKLLGMATLQTDFHSRCMRLFEFVRAYGTDFYGKKFLVRVPFVLSKQDPETLKVTTSLEVAEGGWLPEGSQPLGLSWENEDIMKVPDGRFRAFVAWAGIKGTDQSRLSPQDKVVQDNGTMYLRASVERQLVFLPGDIPCALLTCQPVYEEAVDAWGGMSLLAWATLAMQPSQASKVFERPFGHFGCKLWPAARYPDAFAVPLRSNIATYGPWKVAGPPGKTRVEVDGTMTPWTYGGWDQMNAAADAKVSNAVTNMQVSESGLVEVVGPPACSLGDVLQAGGPNVTNIQVGWGKDGITTSYRFETYTPRFGVFAKSLGERIKRAGQTGVELRKAVRAGFREQVSNQETAQSAARGFMANAPAAIRMRSPHEVVVCHSESDGEYPEGWRQSPKMVTYEEVVGLLRAEDDEAFRKTAMCSLDGLLRPFTTKKNGENGLAGFAEHVVGTGMNCRNLNPFEEGNDVAWLAHGDVCTGANSYREGNDEDNTRAVGLRAPIVACGWGRDLQGDPTPGDGAGDWFENVLRRPDKWRAGPLDPLFDQYRGVWTFHTNRMGVVGSGGIGAGASGVVQLPSSGNLLVWNPWSVGVSGEKKVAVAYFADTNRWNIIAADC